MWPVLYVGVTSEGLGRVMVLGTTEVAPDIDHSGGGDGEGVVMPRANFPELYTIDWDLPSRFGLGIGLGLGDRFGEVPWQQRSRVLSPSESPVAHDRPDLE